MPVRYMPTSDWDKVLAKTILKIKEIKIAINFDIKMPVILIT